MIRFSLCSNERFQRLHRILTVASEPEAEAMSPEDQLCAALDGLEGIATRDERAAVLGEEPDAQQSVARVTWGTVGNLRVAAGGEDPASVTERLEQIRRLVDLTRWLPVNTGTKALRDSGKAGSGVDG